MSARPCLLGGRPRMGGLRGAFRVDDLRGLDRWAPRRLFTMCGFSQLPYERALFPPVRSGAVHSTAEAMPFIWPPGLRVLYSGALSARVDAGALLPLTLPAHPSPHVPDPARDNGMSEGAGCCQRSAPRRGARPRGWRRRVRRLLRHAGRVSPGSPLLALRDGGQGRPQAGQKAEDLPVTRLSGGCSGFYTTRLDCQQHGPTR